MHGTANLIMTLQFSTKDPYNTKPISSLSHIMEEPIGLYPALLKYLTLTDPQEGAVIVFSWVPTNDPLIFKGQFQIHGHIDDLA